VEILTRLRHTLLDRLRTEFEAWRPNPIHASMFGSAARGDGDASSDIDLLLIRPDRVDEDQSPWADQVDRLRRQVQAWTGNRCQAFQLDRARLSEHIRAKDPLVGDWLRDTVTLAGPDLRTVVRRLPAPDGDR
jgi:predicted nucleotidyltransferase